MDLFAVVKLEKPKQVTIGVRPRRENEQPLLEAAAGHLAVFAAAGPEDSPPLQVTPVQSVAPTVEMAHEEEAHAESSDSVEILKVEEVLKPDEVARELKRKGEASGSGTSKRRRYLVEDMESSAEEETSAPGADKEAAETSFSLLTYFCNHCHCRHHRTFEKHLLATKIVTGYPSPPHCAGTLLMICNLCEES
jgi:hypothetical protein